MKIKVYRSQRGIALIQVLIIAIILTMLGIFINQSVREQVRITSTIQNSQQANVFIETIEAELLHALLTNKRYRDIDSDNVYAKNWNFYNQKFSPQDNVQIELQDLNGLLSLNYMNQSAASRLFEELGHEGDKVRTFFDSLKDWKDKDDLKRLNGAESDYYEKLDKQVPRNGYLQSMAELLSIRSSEFLPKEEWQKYFSLGLVSRFNPLNAPDLLLKAFLNDERTWQQVIELRSQNQLNMLAFYRLTGVDASEAITFTTGRLIKVNIMVNLENNKLSKSFQVELRPNASKRPVIISDVKWNEV